MSLILHYKFDQSDVTIDSSGNSATIYSLVVAVSTLLLVHDLP